MSVTIDELSGLLTIPSFIEQLESVVKTIGPVVFVVTDLDHLLGANKTDERDGGDAWIDDRLDGVCAADRPRPLLSRV